ncbi:TonB-dependent receptor [Pseudorhodoferax sp.]|uniref:TonB-dependent receptor n=1 Tax=Pseudorhodoferax sp. TaxID=1993553 RepID=UPI002DD63C04|nr:TonB-dependent receptor [Pseudorhodoferax sp.]
MHQIHLSLPATPPLAPHSRARALLMLAMMAAASSAAQTTEAGQLAVITVTAERRAESVRDVPSSVSTLAGEVLDVLNTSGQDIRLLSGRVPSLNIESSFGRAFPRFYLRGYGNTDFRLNASQPVSLVYDDVVHENPILKGFPVFDVERVEVLRGPQGTLFGRNTPAGVVKFDSVKPGKDFEGYASLGLAQRGTSNLEGAVNLPLGGGLAARVSLMDQRRDDWVKNSYAPGLTQDFEGYRDSALRAQLLYDGGRDFNALVNVHARDMRGSARLFRANIIQPGSNELVDTFDIDSISTDGKNEQRVESAGASLRLRFGLGGGLTLHSITAWETVDAYSRGDIDGGYGASFLPASGPGVIPFASESADGMPRHRQLSQELRVESAPGAVSWQAGLYAFNEDYRVESFSYDSLAGSVQDGYQRVRQKNDALAAFGAINVAVAPDLRLRAGLRYTQDKKDFSVEAYENSGFVPCVLSGKCTLAQLAAQEPDGDLSATPKDNKLSWDLSATWALDKDVNLYARAATGFRGSSVQGASAFNGKSVAAPETNLSFEAGVKADLMDRRARLAFSAYRYTVKDLQLTAVGGAANANILLNADEVAGQGFELDLQALLGEHWLATLGLGYNATRIKDPGLAVAVCAACTATDPLTAGGQALIDGNPLPQAPRRTANFTLKYALPVAGGEFYAFTDWVYRSQVNFFLYESPEFTGKSLLEGGLRLGYTWGGGKYDAAAYVRNINNQIRVVGGIDFNNLTGFVNEPRSFGVTFKAAF